MGEGRESAAVPEGWWLASDGNHYPPDAEPDWSQVPDDGEPLLSPGAAKVALRLAVGGVVLLIVAMVGLLVVRGRGPGPIREGDLARADDFALDIMRCPTQPGETAAGSIRNDSDQTISFRIEVPYVDAEGNDLVVESVIVDNLNPLEASRWEMGPAPDGSFDCAGDRNQVFYEAIAP